MLTRQRLLALLFAMLSVLGLSVVTAGNAAAGPNGHHCFQNSTASIGSINVRWVNYTVYDARVPVGNIEGERLCVDGGVVDYARNAEPWNFTISSSDFCVRWRISKDGGDTWSAVLTTRGPSTVGIHPGDGYVGQWLVDARSLRC